MRRVLYAFVLCATVLWPSTRSQAQNIENTITVEPANIDVQLLGGDQQSTVITITNQYDAPVSLTAEISGVEEGSGRIVPNEEANPDLESAIKLSETDISIAPHSRYFLTITVNDSDALPAGGQYAAVVLTQNNQKSEVSSIRPQLSVGLFIVKKQGANPKIDLVKHAWSRERFQFPTAVEIEFLNDGNVYLVPRGYVRIFDDSFVYFETVLNEQSQVIFPTERYGAIVPIFTSISSGWLPKKITAEIGYRADGIDNQQIVTEYFWYVPWPFIPSLIVLFAFGIYSILFTRSRIKRRK